MQKAVSGYHLLMILTNVDGRLNVKEDLVIKDWLSKKFSEKVDLDNEMEVISSLSQEDYPIHFHEHMNLFYTNTTNEERVEFLQFAMDIIKADGKIDPEENKFFNELFDAWNEVIE